MKNKTRQFGLTIIEILVVVAVIAILVTITVGITSRVDTAIKERKTRAAIDLLATALEKYYQFHKEFPLIDKTNSTDKVDDTYTLNDLYDDIKAGLTAATPQGTGTPDVKFASIQGIYFCLNKTPVSRDIISKLDNSVVSNENPSGSYLKINDGVREYDLFYVTDAWKTPLQYTYDKQNDSFPLIESAGPDKVFGDLLGTVQEISDAEDNIKSR